MWINWEKLQTVRKASPKEIMRAIKSSNALEKRPLKPSELYTFALNFGWEFYALKLALWVSILLLPHWFLFSYSFLLECKCLSCDIVCQCLRYFFLFLQRITDKSFLWVPYGLELLSLAETVETLAALKRQTKYICIKKCTWAFWMSGIVCI